MPGVVLHVGATVQCLHQAPATSPPAQTRAFVSGQPIATTANTFLVAGCPFVVALKPQPCVTIKWILPSTRVFVGGAPALLTAPPGPGPGSGICQSAEQAPQGAPLISAIQTRVIGG
jgi:hypothetical protein